MISEEKSSKIFFYHIVVIKMVLKLYKLIVFSKKLELGKYFSKKIMEVQGF